MSCKCNMAGTISSSGVLIGLSQAIKSVFMTLTEIAVLIIKLAANGGAFFLFFFFFFDHENRHSLSHRLTVTSSSDPSERPKRPMSSPVINLFVCWIPLQVSYPARVVLWRCGAHGYAFTVTDTHMFQGRVFKWCSTRKFEGLASWRRSDFLVWVRLCQLLTCLTSATK